MTATFGNLGTTSAVSAMSPAGDASAQFVDGKIVSAKVASFARSIDLGMGFRG